MPLPLPHSLPFQPPFLSFPHTRVPVEYLPTFLTFLPSFFPLNGRRDRYQHRHRHDPSAIPFSNNTLLQRATNEKEKEPKFRTGKVVNSFHLCTSHIEKIKTRAIQHEYEDSYTLKPIELLPKPLAPNPNKTYPTIKKTAYPTRNTFPTPTSFLSFDFSASLPDEYSTSHLYEVTSYPYTV